MSSYTLLINRASGAGEANSHAEEICATVREIFTGAGHHILASVIDPGKIEEEIKDAIAGHPDAIIIGGGDGSVSTAARLLGGTNIALGILPMGTFNLAARDLGIPLETEAAARFLTTATVHPIDVLDVSGHTCLCTTVFGFYPEFSRIFENRGHGGRWWRKTFKLLAGMPITFGRARPIPLSWKGAGTAGSARTKFAAFVPGRYKSATGVVPARTDFRSGRMTAYIGTHRTAGAAMRGMLDYLLGRHEENERLQVIQSPSLELRAAGRKHLAAMLDGEILRLKLPVHLDILPAHLLVLTTPGQLE